MNVDRILHIKTAIMLYICSENLAVDTYLVSQMDADQFVPIKTVASFNQVKRITHNIDLIVDVLKGNSLELNT
jgi:la-related protein 4